MKKTELIKVLGYLATAVGKSPPDNATEIYFDLLGDLPIETLQTAAKCVALAHKWATFPTVAELREAAVDVSSGQIVELSSAEAWRLAWRAASRTDLEQDGSLQRACDGLPPLVMEAMITYGIVALINGHEPITVVRSQFIKIFDQLRNKERSHALLPAVLRQSIAQIGQRNKALPKETVAAIENMGRFDGGGD